MAENMYCKGNKILSEEGRKQWDEIFGKKDKACEENCECGGGKCKNKPEK